jgi:hypothetical protein
MEDDTVSHHSQPIETRKLSLQQLDVALSFSQLAEGKAQRATRFRGRVRAKSSTRFPVSTFIA